MSEKSPNASFRAWCPHDTIHQATSATALVLPAPASSALAWLMTRALKISSSLLEVLRGVLRYSGRSGDFEGRRRGSGGASGGRIARFLSRPL